MQFCSKCGTELSEEVEICTVCGCKINKTDGFVDTKKSNNINRMPKALKIWIILGVVVVFIGIISTFLFAPRNLKMDDFKKTNLVGAIIQYGIPKSIDFNEESGMYLQYEDMHDFYGITPSFFTVYPDENKVVFFFSSDDGYDVYKKINRHCEFEENLLDSFHKFSYGELEITTCDYDGSYVSIEID